MPLLILFFTSFLFGIWFVKIWKSFRNPVWSKMPGPSYVIPFVGNYLDLMRNNVSALHTPWAKQYGPIYRYYTFGRIIVMVSDPNLIKYILLNNNLFDKNVMHYRILKKAVGNGLITQTNEDEHKRHRDIISPAFAHNHLKPLIPIFHAKGKILVEEWLKKIGTKEPVDIKDDIAKATSDVIGEAAFGYKLNSQRNNSSSSIYSIFKVLTSVGFNFFVFLPGLKRVQPQFYKLRGAARALRKEVEKIIDQKEEKQRVKKGNESDVMRDLLDILMESESENGQRLTREELADHTKTFLLAGYETSSLCILWTMYLLARNPNIQQKLADEVQSVLGKDKFPTAEDIDKMPYLLNVLRESLRVCPPVPFVFRHVAEDVTLGGYFVPKGTLININIYHQHHSSPVWQNHEVFDPERWTSADIESNLLGSYLPFIIGARNCIGNKFAMLEIRVLLAMIIQKLKFAPEVGQKEVEKTCTVVMVPRTPIRLLFEERK